MVENESSTTETKYNGLNKYCNENKSPSVILKVKH